MTKATKQMKPTYDEVVEKVKDAIDGVLMNHVDTMKLTINSDALAVEAIRAMQDMMPEFKTRYYVAEADAYQHFKIMGRDDVESI